MCSSPSTEETGGILSLQNEEQNAKIFAPEDYEDEFGPMEYLEYYYSERALAEGTRLGLFALQIFSKLIERELPNRCDRRRMIDIGSGPTVYSAICFRNIVDEIYLSDYLERNLAVVERWLNGASPTLTGSTSTTVFDWSGVIKQIARSEGFVPTVEQLEKIEAETRKALLAGGLLKADVKNPKVLTPNSSADEQMGIKNMQTFDILVSIFCLESACSNLSEYKNSLENMINLIRPGGKLILGSVINQNVYNAGICTKNGKSKYFTLLEVDTDFLLESLNRSGMDTSEKSMRQLTIEEDGVIFLMATKHSN